MHEWQEKAAPPDEADTQLMEFPDSQLPSPSPVRPMPALEGSGGKGTLQRAASTSNLGSGTSLEFAALGSELPEEDEDAEEEALGEEMSEWYQDNETIQIPE